MCYLVVLEAGSPTSRCRQVSTALEGSWENPFFSLPASAGSRVPWLVVAPFPFARLLFFLFASPLCLLQRHFLLGLVPACIIQDDLLQDP